MITNWKTEQSFTEARNIFAISQTRIYCTDKTLKTYLKFTGNLRKHHFQEIKAAHKNSGKYLFVILWELKLHLCKCNTIILQFNCFVLCQVKYPYLMKLLYFLLNTTGSWCYIWIILLCSQRIIFCLMHSRNKNLLHY